MYISLEQRRLITFFIDGIFHSLVFFLSPRISLTPEYSHPKTYVFDDNLNKSLQDVQQTPKTENGVRVIPLPSSLVPKLKEQRKTQLENRLKYGESYHISDYVFTDEVGRTIDNKRPNRTLQAILKKLDINPIKFHGLRKTYATRLFENGVPPKTVQTLLGHADIQTTLNIYTQVMEEEKYKAVDTLNSIFSF